MVISVTLTYFVLLEYSNPEGLLLDSLQPSSHLSYYIPVCQRETKDTAVNSWATAVRPSAELGSEYKENASLNPTMTGMFHIIS